MWNYPLHSFNCLPSLSVRQLGCQAAIDTETHLGAQQARLILQDFGQLLYCISQEVPLFFVKSATDVQIHQQHIVSQLSFDLSDTFKQSDAYLQKQGERDHRAIR